MNRTASQNDPRYGKKKKKKKVKKTYKDNSIKGQVTGVSELLAEGTESQELVLDDSGSGSILQVLNGLAYQGVARSISMGG